MFAPMSDPIYDIRVQNLRLLIQQWEGTTTLAKKLGHANPSYLVQLAGPNPRRTVSEKVARKMEEKLRLPPRWMDEPHADAHVQIDDAFLRECVLAVSVCIRDAGLALDPEVIATLTSLAYEHARAKGEVDRAFIKGLLDLTKKKH